MRTAEYLPSRTAKVLGNSINKIKKLYLRGGFVVNLLLMDQEFDKVEPETDEGIEVNITGAWEHIADIKRSICSDKKRCQAIVSVSP